MFQGLSTIIMEEGKFMIYTISVREFTDNGAVLALYLHTWMGSFEVGLPYWISYG